jgi:hypothetical protein
LGKFTAVNYRFKNTLALALPIQILLVRWIREYPEFVEQYYSQGIYPYIALALRGLYGWIPFSVGDLLYTLLIFLGVRYLVVNRLLIRTKPVSFARNLLAVASTAYLTFHLLWGFNYYREPLSRRLDLKDSCTREELVDFTSLLLEKTNALQQELAGHDSLQVSFPFEHREVFKKISSDFRPLTEKTNFEYPNPSIKTSLYSLALTYMGYGGYLNPFTLEAQVNRKIPMFRFPVVSCHEIAHQLGYAAENEANFIGYLAALHHEDDRVRYAAHSYALGYCLSELRTLDDSLFREIYAQVNRGVQKDYEALNAFWTAYENPLEPVFKETFDTFLKANNQAAGIRSYNLVVSLLVSFHERHPL